MPFTVRPARNLSANTDRGPSSSIWSDCPVELFQAGSMDGQFFEDDFQVLGTAVASGAAYAGAVGRWNGYLHQGATLTDEQKEGGVVSMQSDGDQEGIVLTGQVGAFRITTTSTLALNQKLWFECRVARSTVAATKHEAFVGLMSPVLSSGLPAAGNPISTTDDTLSTTPHLIGFHCKGGGAPTEWQFAYLLASGTVVYPTNLTTLMNSVKGAVMSAAQYVKLGFVFDPNAYPKVISSASTGQTAGQIARPLITVFVDGMPAAAFLTSTNVQGAAFPTGFMAPTIAMMNLTASSPGYFSADWIRVAQLANS